MRLAVGLIAGVLAVYAAGCEDGQDSELTPSPTPPSAFGESLEDHAWDGWYSYSDDQVSINTYLTFAVMEYRDGLWCGVLFQDYAQPGAYLAYASVSGWTVLVDNDGSNSEQYGEIPARAYGVLVDAVLLEGWIDSVNDPAASDATSLPTMEEADMDLHVYSIVDDQLTLDPLFLTTFEVMALINDAAASTTSSPSGEPNATEPNFTGVELPPVVLSGARPYSPSMFHANYCAWAAQPDDTTRAAGLHP